MDPRWIAATAFDVPSDEERERPPFWRYWRTLPSAGGIGLYPGGWYSDPIDALSTGRIGRAAFDDQLLRIKTFEQALAEEGALILKFWLHLSKREQNRQLRAAGKDPLVGLRASDSSWTAPADYDAYLKAAGHAIRATMSGKAPWFIVEGGNDNFRRASVLGTLTEHLSRHLDQRADALRARAKVLAKDRKRAEKARRKARKKRDKNGTKDRPLRAPARRVLDALNMKRSLSVPDYAAAFHRQQIRLHEAQRRARAAGMSTVVVFEGWDAAGKGGALRRLTFALNARDYRIVPIAALNDEERAHHYLWRFWRHVGRAGRMTIFDRSWYGRVLVERVECLIPEESWMRAYAEINDFESQLAEHDTIVIKIWLHLTKYEHLKRFKQRSKLAHKQWKLTDEDWRNREKWDDYVEAVNDMVSRTSTTAAPWTLVAANEKRYCRVKVLRTVADAMERALKRRKIARPGG
jgi:polyphosphate:AMP phosphotransferase